MVMWIRALPGPVLLLFSVCVAMPVSFLGICLPHGELVLFSFVSAQVLGLDTLVCTASLASGVLCVVLAACFTLAGNGCMLLQPTVSVTWMIWTHVLCLSADAPSACFPSPSTASWCSGGILNPFRWEEVRLNRK